MSITAGIYKIVCAANPSGATSFFNPVQDSAMLSWTLNESPDQVWSLAQMDGGWVFLNAPLDMMGYRIANGDAHDGQMVVLYRYGGADWSSLRWDIVEDGGSLTVNGATYPTYTVRSQLDSSLYMTSGAYGTVGTVRHAILDKETRKFADSQRFAFVPAVRVDSRLSAPQNIGTYSGSHIALAKDVVIPIFDATGGQWDVQARYRIRKRKAGASQLYGWSKWREMVSNAQTGFGWGSDQSVTNVRLKRENGKIVFLSGVSVDNTGAIDRTDIEFSIRQYVASWRSEGTYDEHPFVSQSNTATIVTARPLELKRMTATRTPDGITYAGELEYWHGSGHVTLWSDIFNSVTVPCWDGTFSAFVPIERHTKTPNSTVAIHFTARDGDGIETSGQGTAALGYNESHGMTITPQVSYTGTLAHISATSTPASDLRCWLVVDNGHGERFVKVGQGGGNRWDFPVPIGTSYRLMLAGQSGSQWAVQNFTVAGISDDVPSYHVCLPDGSRDFAIRFDLRSKPKYTKTYTRKKSTADAENRDREVASYSRETKAPVNVSGAIERGHEKDLDWLAHQSHVVFRDPYGYWTQAGVDSFTVEGDRPDFLTFSAKLSEEVW